MKHTPLTSTSPHQGVPLITEVLAFFESVLVAAPSEQDASEPATSRKGPGHPITLHREHLWLACVCGLFRQAQGIADVWRLLTRGPIGSFASIRISQQGVRQRLLGAGLQDLTRLLERVNAALCQQEKPPDALGVAAFAKEIVALDESTLDEVARLCEDVRPLPDGSPVLRVGKLAGLFDLRRQQWVRLHFRSDVLAHCKTGVLLLLEGLEKGSLILADLGYFSFAYFDYLTDEGYFWLSRMKQGVSFERLHVFFEDGETLDALIWLGTHRSDQAAHAVRLVQFRHGETLYRYLTNVCDPHQLSLRDIAYLYARRWDIELAFKLLKKHLGLRLWWTCDPLLVMQQIYLTLIVAQVIHHWQLSIAAAAKVDPFDVSAPCLLSLLSEACWPTPDGLIACLVEQGPFHKLIRPHRRIFVQAPCIPQEALIPLPVGLILQRRARHTVRKRTRHPRTTDPLDFRFVPRFLL